MPAVDVQFSIATTPNGELAVAELPVPAALLEREEAVKRVVANLVNQVLPQALQSLSPPNGMFFRTPDAHVDVQVDPTASTITIHVPVSRIDLSFDTDPNNPGQTRVSIGGADASTVQRVAGVVSELAERWPASSQ